MYLIEILYQHLIIYCLLKIVLLLCLKKLLLVQYIYQNNNLLYGVRFIAKAAKMLNEQYQDIHYNIVSGDAVDIIEKLDRGLILQF